MSSCLLMAELLGGTTPRTTAAATEARHALERCQNRIKLAAENNGGTLLEDRSGEAVMRFATADAAVLAACEMIERVYKVPPVSGARYGLRVGIRLGEDGEADRAETERLAELARPGEALMDATTAASLSTSTRQFAQAITVEEEGPANGLVAIRRHAGLAGPAAVERRQRRLRVRHRGRTLYVDAQHPRLLIGREPSNDIVLDDPRASRHHARIDFRDNGFALIDHSSNGSWVAAPGGGELFVKGNETALPGEGRIGPGFPAIGTDADLVLFEMH